MITSYALLLSRCGLSHREAADFHGVRLDTIRSWSIGRNRAPDGVMTELRALYAQQVRVAAEAVCLLAEAATVELGLASDDVEARSLGWPCVGAQAASLGIVVATVEGDVRIVPRGSTAATAGAADQH